MKLIIGILFSLIISTAYSQNQFVTIEGFVKDFQDVPITSVTVRALHSRAGTLTLTDGSFRLGGVKIGDTLIFTSVPWQKAFFVVEKIYNILDLKLVRDTLKAFVKDERGKSYFSISSSISSYAKRSSPIHFLETATPVKEIKDFEKDRIFTMVEIHPNFYSNYPGFSDSLANDINKLNLNSKPKKQGDILVYFWIKGDKKIEISSIKGDIKEEIKELIEKRFESITNIYVAMQNGKSVDVLAVAKFKISIASNKTITLTMVNQ